MLTEERKTAEARMKVDAYLGPGINDRKQQIIDWHSALDPESHCAKWIIDSGTPVAGQIMEQLAAHPEALTEIAQMQPRQRERILGNLEGKLMAEQHFAQQMAQQQAQWAQQPRRVSSAPPPISAPRGAANPPSDLFRLASKGERVDDYVKMRQQQERSRD